MHIDWGLLKTPFLSHLPASPTEGVLGPWSILSNLPREVEWLAFNTKVSNDLPIWSICVWAPHLKNFLLQIFSNELKILVPQCWYSFISGRTSSPCVFFIWLRLEEAFDENPVKCFTKQLSKMESEFLSGSKEQTVDTFYKLNSNKNTSSGKVIAYNLHHLKNNWNTYL